MKLKYILTLLIISINTSISLGQTGLYKCNKYEFKSESEPSTNRKENDTKILTLNLEAINNRYFMWRDSDQDKKDGEDVFFKWNIKNKIDANYVKDKNYVQSTYEARMELLGVEVGETMYLFKIDDLNDKSLNIIIYSPKFNTRHYFYNLTKL